MASRAHVRGVKVEGNSLSAREDEKIQVATIVLERESWTVDGFAKNLGVRDYGFDILKDLGAYGLDLSKDLGADVGIDNDATIAYFGPRGDQGWIQNICHKRILAIVEAIVSLYMVICHQKGSTWPRFGECG